MSAPAKPWEAVGLSRSAPSPIMNQPQLNNLRVGLGGVGGVGSGGAPPLPPRNITNPRPLLSYPTPSYGYPHMGGYSPHYGHMGSSYDYYMRRNDDFESRLIQMAEESSQPAFQSIEAFVRSFSSMTMMLESSYQAMQMSFRAILSVADNMSRLRSVLGRFFSSLAILRLIHWFYRKILYFLGGVTVEEAAWEAAQVSRSGAEHSSLWPVFSFIGLMFGGPYIVYRILAPFTSSVDREWDPSRDGGDEVVGLYDFEPTEETDLGFKRGERLLLANGAFSKRRGGFLLAASHPDGPKGYVPFNRIARITQRTRGLKEDPSPSQARPTNLLR